MAQSTLTQFQILPRPNPAGLFFCLASDTVQGLYFCPATYKPQASVYSGFSAINAIIPPQHQKRLQSFTVAFPLIRPIPAHTIQQLHKRLYTACDTPEGIPSSAAPPQIPDTTATPDAVQLSTAAYYNKVYKRAVHASPAGQLLPCADRWQVLHPAHPLRGQRLHLYRVSPALSTRLGSPVTGARRAARNHWRLSPHLFSGFRPIANRGQQ